MSQFLYFSILILLIQNVCRKTNPNAKDRMDKKIKTYDAIYSAHSTIRNAYLFISCR